jgi:thiamine biosynthesis protein ThiS
VSQIILKIVVNGSPLEIPEGSTLADLLHLLEVDPARVAVEQNREIVPRSEFASRKIASGDTLEVVHFVGGG